MPLPTAIKALLTPASQSSQPREAKRTADTLGDPHVMRVNAGPIFIVSALFFSGQYYSWHQGDETTYELDSTLLLTSCVLCALILGMILGQRVQQLEFRRPVAAGWAAAWRVALLWVGLSMFAEFLRTDGTVTVTLNRLSPWIFLGSASLLTLSVVVSRLAWPALSRREGRSVLAALRLLPNSEKIAIVGVAVAVAGLSYTVIRDGLLPFKSAKDREGAEESLAPEKLQATLVAAGQRTPDAAPKRPESPYDTQEQQGGTDNAPASDPLSFTEALSLGGYRELFREEGYLADEDEKRFPVDLEAGQGYAFIGACACSDLDLLLYSTPSTPSVQSDGADDTTAEPNGQDDAIVAGDLLFDALPIVEYSPSDDGTFFVEVRMVSCTNQMDAAPGNGREGRVPAPCSWNLRAFVR